MSDHLFSGGGPVKDGPGHYTMVREGLSTDPRLTPPKPQPPRAPTPASTEAASGPPASKGSKVLAILGLTVVLLLMVAVVVVLVMTS